MNTLFLLMFLICGGFLIAGLIKPELLSKVFKRTLARKQIGLIFGISTVAALLLFSVTAPAKQQEIKNETGLTVQTQQTPTKTAPVTVEKIETKTEVIPFTPTTENDPTLAQGQTKIKQVGVNGTKEVKAKVTYVDGKETKREPLPDVVTLQPVPQITSVGTYVAPVQDGSSGGGGYTNVDGNQVQSPGSNPDGATAQCNDGTYSYSQHRQGTCSGHGGVAAWL